MGGGTARTARWLAAMVVLGLLAAGCGSDDGDDGDDAAGGVGEVGEPAVEEATSTTATAVATGSLPIGTDEIPFGEVLVDGDGFALYAFTQDDGTGTSTCTGECAEKWPPVIVDDADGVELPDGVDAEVGVVARDTGESQLTIAGRPMYVMADDQPGLALCQGGEGAWWVVGLDGEPITTTEPVS